MEAVAEAAELLCEWETGGEGEVWGETEGTAVDDGEEECGRGGGHTEHSATVHTSANKPTQHVPVPLLTVGLKTYCIIAIVVLARRRIRSSFSP